MALSELIARREEMVSRESISVFCGTWNVNGGKNVNNIAFRHEDSFEEWFYSATSTVIVRHMILLQLVWKKLLI
jgi:hypothetical protein